MKNLRKNMIGIPRVCLISYFQIKFRDTFGNENVFNNDFVMLSELIINGRLIDLMGFRYNKFTII